MKSAFDLARMMEVKQAMHILTDIKEKMFVDSLSLFVLFGMVIIITINIIIIIIIF